MDRVFIFTDGMFPRHGANSNYIQYLALCIKEAGMQPYIISQLNKEIISSDADEVEYRGLKILRAEFGDNRLTRFVQSRTGFLRKRISILKKMKIDSGDYVFVFITRRSFLRGLLKLREEIGFKIIGGVLELFDRKEFDGKHPDREYRIYLEILERYFSQFDLIFPISTFIEEYFQNLGCKTFLIPIMADCSEFEREEKEFSKYRIIIPAHGMMKDSLSVMLKSYCALERSDLERSELHLCGVKRDKVRQALSAEEWEIFQKHGIIHKWMKYDELIDLYRKMHYLLLVRETCQMTRANFPSKVPETMNFGIVPLASKVGDYTRYYLENGVNSIFIEEHDIESCRRVLSIAINLNREEYLEYSSNAISCVQHRFDYHNWSLKLEKALRDLQK